MRESFLKLLAGEPADQIIWTADISYWIDGQRQIGQANPDWYTEAGYLKLCQELGILPYYWYQKFWLGEPEYDDRVELITKQQDNTCIRLWETPVGCLREESSFMAESCSTACTRHPVNTKNDIETLLYILEHRKLCPACLDDYNDRLELWAEYDGLPSIALPRSPLPSFFCEWAGIQNGVYLLMDYPDLIGRSLTLMAEQEEPIIEAVCKAAPPLVHFADNLSSDNFTGYFDEFMAAFYRSRLEKLHTAGVKCAVHLDGTVRGLLPKLAEVGFDAIEAVTPQPAGDVAVEEMRDIAQNDQVILWGGVPGAMFSTPYTWNDMESHLRKLLDSWSGTRFVVGVADQVPPDGNIQYCKKIAEMIDSYQQ
jgi:hypothetical protein